MLLPESMGTPKTRQDDSIVEDSIDFGYRM